MQDLLLTHFDASTIEKSDLLSNSLAVSLASLEFTSQTPAVIDLLTFIRCSNFNSHLSHIQVSSIACSRQLSGRVVKKQKHYVLSKPISAFQKFVKRVVGYDQSVVV